jgi:hypothetical protein
VPFLPDSKASGLQIFEYDISFPSLEGQHNIRNAFFCFLYTFTFKHLMSHTEEKQDKVLEANEPVAVVENTEKVEPLQEEHVGSTTQNTTPLSDSTESPIQTNTTTNTTVENQNLPENVGILKEAFPGTDVEVIEAVLQTQNGNVESSFELLLGISDPNYNATPVEVTPPMPPRPQQQQQGESGGGGGAPYAYWEREAQPEPRSVEEQMRMDEELAKKLALEDQRRSEQRKVDQRR